MQALLKFVAGPPTGITLALLTVVAPGLWAQTPAPDVLAPTQTTEAPADPATPTDRTGPQSTFRFHDHPTLQIGDVKVAFRARVGIDDRESAAPISDPSDSLDVARRRIGVEGEIGKLFEYQIEREFQDEDAWKDVYIDYRQFRALQVQAGKFKLPFSLDETTGPAQLDFVNRSLAATRLAPGRDRGAMVHGQLFDRFLRYEAGVFQHDGQNARPGNPARVFGDRTGAFRLVVLPFRTSHSQLKDLRLGLAFTRGGLNDAAEGLPGLRARTSAGWEFFDRKVWVKGSRERRGLEARWRHGPVGLATEYIRVTDERLEQSADGSDLSPLLATGWYVSGTLALTGEKKTHGLDEPKRPFGRNGIGALELALRLEDLAFGSVADDGRPSTSPRADVVLGNADRAVTLGVNWYLNRWVKFQFNVIRDRLTDPSQGPLPSEPVIWSRALRLQFTL